MFVVDERLLKEEALNLNRTHNFSSGAVEAVFNSFPGEVKCFRISSVSWLIEGISAPG